MRIAIVGLGLIGTSVALAVKRHSPDAELIGVDRADLLRHPRIVETFAIASTDLSTVGGADLIVLAAPVAAILETLPLLGTAGPRPTVIDTASTKRAILKAARDAGLWSFVGGHPMAGAERSGPDAARADLFDRRLWFLIPTIGSGPASAFAEATADKSAAPLHAARQFVDGLGAQAVVMTDDGEAHDRLMAAISHLPQVVVSALMARVGEVVGREGLGYAGSGLRDTTRLAASEASVWESVLATNADAVRPLLLELAADLQQIAGQLEDPSAMRRLFGLANMYRREL